MDKINTNFQRNHHKIVWQALQNFNSDYLQKNNILFGGGTRIALELDEFRESVDINFLCSDSQSYKAVRSQASQKSLGNLVTQEFDHPREIRIDRDAVRCFMQIDNTIIKLEFVACADYQLQADKSLDLSVPILDKTSCFITKLLANADRYYDYPYKDIFDLLMMYQNWGDVPERAWQVSDEIYSQKIVKNGLIKSLTNIQNNPDKFIKIAVNDLKILPNIAEHLILHTSNEWLQKIEKL